MKSRNITWLDRDYTINEDEIEKAGEEWELEKALKALELKDRMFVENIMRKAGMIH